MRRLLHTHIAAGAMTVLFALAATWNAGIATVSAPNAPLTVLAADTQIVAHGPTIPPDPWEEVRLA